jgi:hypothetical protein
MDLPIKRGLQGVNLTNKERRNRRERGRWGLREKPQKKNGNTYLCTNLSNDRNGLYWVQSPQGLCT